MDEKKALKAHYRKRDLFATEIEKDPSLLPEPVRYPAPRPISGTLQEALDRLTSRFDGLLEERSCEICGEPTTDTNEPPLCHRPGCERRLKARRWAALPKRQLLKHTKTPELYREDFDVDRIGGYWQGRWPSCEYGRGSAEDWIGEPPFVTIVGPNQYGKSRLAAEMCVRAIRADQGESVSHCIGRRTDRIYPMLWIRPHQLLKEDRELKLGQARDLMNYAERARYLVIDELEWAKDGIERVADLCEERHSCRRPTIWTSHLHFYSQTDPQREPSIQDLSVMIHARLKAGMVINLGDRR